jgi:hypothetical protein
MKKYIEIDNQTVSLEGVLLVRRQYGASPSETSSLFIEYRDRDRHVIVFVRNANTAYGEFAAALEAQE